MLDLIRETAACMSGGYSLYFVYFEIYSHVCSKKSEDVYVVFVIKKYRTIKQKSKGPKIIVIERNNVITNVG